MARSYAKIHVTIWDDPEFCTLPGDAQRAYLFLLSQPKMRSCGVIDVRTKRWAPKLGLSTDELELALGRLEHAGFVAWDTDTDELAVRTFVRHDSGDTKNPKVWIGVWSSLEAVESSWLRSYVAFHMPEGAYEERSKASMIRPGSFPERHPQDQQSDADPIGERIGDPIGDAIASGISLSYSDSLSETTTGANPPNEPPTRPRSSTERSSVVQAAIAIIVDHEYDRAADSQFIDDEPAYRAGITKRIRTEQGAAIAATAVEHPEWTATQIAARHGGPLTSLDDLGGAA